MNGLKRENKKINWRKGSGEFLAFTVISIFISVIIVLLVAVLQFSTSLNNITKAVEAAGRAVAICTSYEDAQHQAQVVAESAISDANITDISTKVSYVTGNDTWESGAYLTVTVAAKYKNPFFSGESKKTALITVENSAGQVIIIPDEFNGISIGENMTVTIYDEINWNRSTTQGRIYEAWKAAGSQFSEGIAVLNGYYLIACTEKFGQVGDKVQFTLENGQVLNCIIADMKSSRDPNYTEYGHIHNGKILVLEMEVDGDYYRRFGNPATTNWKPEWHSKPVKCKNMGPYI